jgi:hypothetical protein
LSVHRGWYPSHARAVRHLDQARDRTPLLRTHMLIPLLIAANLAACSRATVHAGDEAFTPLFDGKTLNGWVQSGGHYDGRADWSVEDGCITGRQSKNREGGLIYTAKPYTEFVLRLECKLDHPFDSGIFLRMAPNGKGAQVTLDDRAGGEIGAIYSDGFLKHNENGIKLWKKNEWNDIEVRCTGKDMRIAVMRRSSIIKCRRIRSVMRRRV